MRFIIKYHRLPLRILGDVPEQQILIFQPQWKNFKSSHSFGPFRWTETGSSRLFSPGLSKLVTSRLIPICENKTLAGKHLINRDPHLLVGRWIEKPSWWMQANCTSLSVIQRAAGYSLLPNCKYLSIYVSNHHHFVEETFCHSRMLKREEFLSGGGTGGSWMWPVRAGFVREICTFLKPREWMSHCGVVFFLKAFFSGQSHPSFFPSCSLTITVWTSHNGCFASPFGALQENINLWLLH